MTPVLLIDFGSTYTKVTAIDLDRELLLGTAASYTTVETDVTEGLANALALLEATTGPLTFAHRYACSSAAGGLRMMASGLVPNTDMTLILRLLICSPPSPWSLHLLPPAAPAGVGGSG